MSAASDVCDHLIETLELAVEQIDRLLEVHDQGLSWSAEKWAGVSREARELVTQAREEAISVSLVSDTKPQP